MTARARNDQSRGEERSTAKRRERERQRHRLEIIESAGRLFADRGFERTTMQDISNDSGFALASIYKHFAGKDEIYDAMIGEIVGAYFEDLQNKFAGVASPIGRIRAAVEGTFAHVERNPAVSRVVLRELRGLGRPGAGQSNPAYDGYRAGLAFYEGLFAEAKAKGEIHAEIEPRVAALTLLGIIFMSLAYWAYYAAPGEKIDASQILRVVLGPVAIAP